MKLPILRRPWVVHVGHMDLALKSAHSYEGKCLSVSTCPDDWCRIAEIGGPRNILTKHDSRFVDFNALTIPAASRKCLFRWAKRRGLLETIPIFELSWFDDEAMGDSYMFFETEAAALAERSAMFGASVRRIVRHVPAASAVASAGFHATSRIACRMYVFAVLLAEERGLDGVWWEDDFDPAGLSAPRGGILPNMISTWNCRVTSTS